MTDLEKQIVKKLNNVISPYNYVLKIEDDIIYMYSKKPIWDNTMICYKWHTLNEMLECDDRCIYSIFDFIELDHLRSNSLEEMMIKMDLVGI